MTVEKKSLRIAYDAGTGADGKKKRKTRTYTNLATNATAEGMKAAADAINGLTNEKLLHVECITVECL